MHSVLMTAIVPTSPCVYLSLFMSILSHRNRALHSDLVAVTLLPRSKWQSRNNALPSGDGQKAEGLEGEVEGSSEVMPTGAVVGILERTDRLYVASFDVSGSTVAVKLQ